MPGECGKLTRELRVPGVYFTGHVTNAALTAYYRSASVYLCLSEHEGFCVPLVEAMHFALPIVARAAAGVPGTLGSGGILLAQPDPTLTGELLARILGDDALRRALGSSPGRDWNFSAGGGAGDPPTGAGFAIRPESGSSEAAPASETRRAIVDKRLAAISIKNQQLAMATQRVSGEKAWN